MREEKEDRKIRITERGGFTLAELLIVVAIIGVLVAIAIPVFTSQLERSREATDLANVRAAYAEVMSAAVSDDTASALRQADGTYQEVVPLKGQEDGWKTAESSLNIGGVTPSDSARWIGAPKAGGKCTVKYSPAEDRLTINWGGGGFSLLASLNAVVNANNWWNHSPAREEAFNALRTTSNDVRKESDLEILNSLAGYFDGMSAEEAEKILGATRYNSAQKNSGTVFFEYGKDKSGSIRISNLDTEYVPYFQDLGYDPRIYVTQGNEYGGWKESDNYTSHGHSYTDQFLFTSDEMIGTSYNEGASFHNINVKFTIVDGKVSNPTVWVDKLSGSGFSSSNE